VADQLFAALHDWTHSDT